MIEPICEIMHDRSLRWRLPYSPPSNKLVWHRLDGPALISSNGIKQWWVNNKRHRLYAPAIECPDGSGSWWVDGELVATEEEMTIWLEENGVDLLTNEGKMAYKLQWL